MGISIGSTISIPVLIVCLGLQRVNNELFRRLAKMERQDIVLLPLASIGVVLGLIEVVVKPAISDLASRFVSESVEPWEEKFFEEVDN